MTFLNQVKPASMLKKDKGDMNMLGGVNPLLVNVEFNMVLLTFILQVYNYQKKHDLFNTLMSATVC